MKHSTATRPLAAMLMILTTGPLLGGCAGHDGQSAQAAKEATDPPYAKGTYGTPSDPAWPHDAPYNGGGGGGHR